MILEVEGAAGASAFGLRGPGSWTMTCLSDPALSLSSKGHHEDKSRTDSEGQALPALRSPAAHTIREAARSAPGTGTRLAQADAEQMNHKLVPGLQVLARQQRTAGKEPVLAGKVKQEH